MGKVRWEFLLPVPELKTRIGQWEWPYWYKKLLNNTGTKNLVWSLSLSDPSFLLLFIIIHFDNYYSPLDDDLFEGMENSGSIIRSGGHIVCGVCLHLVYT